MTNKSPLVSIIIPHWNGIETLSECIDSLLKTDFDSYEIIIVDNASTDGSQEWIRKNHPYGWVHWYCDFYMGKRSEDDEWQINRWINTAGPNSRFRKRLINMLKKKRKKYNDFTISPKIRQTLQHWAYVLKKRDLN